MLIPIIYFFFKKKLLRNILIGVLIFQTIFMSRSVTSVFALCCFIGFYILFNANIHTIFLSIITIFFLNFAFTNLFPGARLTGIIYRLSSYTSISQVAQIALVDGSSSARAADIYYSNISILKDFPRSFGHSLADYKDVEKYVYVHKNKIFGNYVMSERIMSGIGSIVFELGLIGLTLPIFLFFRFFLNPDKAIRSISISLPLIMLLFLSPLHPLVGLLIGLNEQSLKDAFTLSPCNYNSI
ncbi:MAG: hypothetical protein HQK54_05710 [Oligoflexales bacterium]|nr:hypothetical protein [Oligoflexales bacterium]